MNPQKIPSLGKLYTIGYADPAAFALLAQYLQEEPVLILDIRLSPRSRWRPDWNKAKLIATYGHRYTWEPRLGNLHYKHRELGIKLAPGYEEAIQTSARLLREGVSLILLCACKHAETCHRSLVATFIQEALQTPDEEVSHAAP